LIETEMMQILIFVAGFMTCYWIMKNGKRLWRNIKVNQVGIIVAGYLAIGVIGVIVSFFGMLLAQELIIYVGFGLTLGFCISYVLLQKWNSITRRLTRKKRKKP